LSSTKEEQKQNKTDDDISIDHIVVSVDNKIKFRQQIDPKISILTPKPSKIL